MLMELLCLLYTQA